MKLYTKSLLGSYTNNVRIYSFAEDHEMTIVVIRNGRKYPYSMHIEEAKILVKFISKHIKNEEDANK